MLSYSYVGDDLASDEAGDDVAGPDDELERQLCRPGDRGDGPEIGLPAGRPHTARTLLHQQLQHGQCQHDQHWGHPQHHHLPPPTLLLHQPRQLVQVAAGIPRALLQIRTLQTG